ncbi:cholecystokinin receptor type A-like [Ostrea edulis]|uniref:cholecystokinin receptor type A-like n=1 Tax=Ostrea edulis TaxID=37623 RepID=UPI002095AB5A|nr:cholecystokinin receptor type A-like [Ostrea edulis]
MDITNKMSTIYDENLTTVSSVCGSNFSTISRVESTTTQNHAILNLTLEELNQIEVQRRLPPMVYLATLILFGVPGNLTVLFVYLFKFESSTHRTFIVALAIIDLVGCVVCMPFEIIEMNFQYTFYAVGACKFFRFNNTFIALTSIFVIIGLSVDRYRRVCKPLKTQMTVFTAKIACGIAVLLAILLSWPILFLLGTRHVKLPYNVTGYDCSTDDKYRSTIYPMVHNAVLFLIFVFAIVLLMVIYILIARKIFKHIKFRSTFKASISSSISTRKTSSTKLSSQKQEAVVLVNVNNTTSPSQKVKPSNDSNMNRSKQRNETNSEDKSKKKITKIAFAICMAFILSYLPHLVITIWTAVKGGFIAKPGPVVSAVLPIVTRSIFINNIINPFIYSFLDRKFRRILLKSICKTHR